MENDARIFASLASKCRSGNGDFDGNLLSLPPFIGPPEGRWSRLVARSRVMVSCRQLVSQSESLISLGSTSMTSSLGSVWEA
jgi:hypothetical protein